MNNTVNFWEMLAMIVYLALVVGVVSIDVVAGDGGICLDYAELERRRRHSRLKGRAYGVKPFAGSVEKRIVFRSDKLGIIIIVGGKL